MALQDGRTKPVIAPKDAVVALVQQQAQAQRAVEALTKAGFPLGDVQQLEADAIMGGSGHGIPRFGPMTQPLRLLWSFVSEERSVLRAYEEQLRAGQHMLVVHVGRRAEAQRATAILAAQGAHSIRYFGRWIITEMASRAGEPGLRAAADESPFAGAGRHVTPVALQSADIFRELGQEEMEHVASVARQVEIPLGTLLAQQGETGHAVYLLQEGEVQLTTTSPQGEVTVRIAGAGESLPLAALLGPGVLITSAYAMTDVRAIEIPCRDFHRLCEHHPEIGMKVYRAIADILGRRYRNTLAHLVGTLERTTDRADVFANV